MEILVYDMIFQTKFKKVKHATPRKMWSVCWSSSSITYVSPLEGNCFNRSSAYQWVRMLPLFYPIYFYAYMNRSFFKILLKIRRFMKLEPLISHTGIFMTFYLSIILDLQNFFHWYIPQRSKLKRPQTQLRPHVLWLMPQIWRQWSTQY